MENSMEVPQTIKNRITIWPSNMSSGYLPPKYETIYSQKGLHPYVHYSIIHGGQDMKTAREHPNGWEGKEDVVHPYSGILLSHKKR